MEAIKRALLQSLTTLRQMRQSLGECVQLSGQCVQLLGLVMAIDMGGNEQMSQLLGE